MIENTRVNLSTTVNKEFPKHLKVELKSQDINNHMFELSFKDLELDSTYTVIVLSVFKEAGTEVKSTATVSDGKAYFRFDTGLIGGDDTVANYVYVKQSAKTADVTSFTFKVSLSEIDKGSREVAKYYNFHYETLLDSFEKDLNDYMTSLPEHVVINDETIDLTVYAKKTDLPDTTEFIKWADMPELQEDKDTIYDDTELREKVEGKQEKLKAGSNIIINAIDNTISAIDTVPDLSAYAFKADLPDLSPYATKAELPDTSQYLTLKDLLEIEVYDDAEIKQELSSKQEKLEAGNNITIEDNKISATIPDVDLSSYALATDIPDTSDYITLADLPDVENYDDTAIKQEISTKQAKLIAGENIAIEDNIISAVDTVQDLKPYALKSDIPDVSEFITANDLPEDKDTTYTAGDNITIDENNVISSTASGGSGGVVEELEWVIPTLGAGWAFGNTIPLNQFMYAKDSKGFVHFKGSSISHNYDESISTSYTIFTLPEGYRPIQTITSLISVRVWGTYHQDPLEIQPNGIVRTNKIYTNSKSTDKQAVYAINALPSFYAER